MQVGLFSELSNLTYIIHKRKKIQQFYLSLKRIPLCNDSARDSLLLLDGFFEIKL